MGLSFDLISEFVKITNDKKESPKEGMVYATVVSGKGGKYVKIDGSDLLTPADTTTDIEDGERVTLLIKDHKAVITGNVTNPSASTTKVDKVTESVNSVSDRVGTFELIVADKVDVKELEAYKATIEVLIAGKATIEDLTATNAKIENLEVKHAEIEDLVADKATIEDLEAVNAVIENLKVKDAEIENAVIDNLEATTAEIKILNADFAQIKTLVNGNLTSDNILSFNLTSEKVTVENAFIKDAMIDTISAGKINAGKINTNSVSIGSEDGGMLITGSTQQFTDKNGRVRIQIGKDASGDFTFVLYGEDGTGQLINQNGITASAIGDGLIINSMVSDDAAISGEKLDISSVITEINSDNSTTIQSSKIYLNGQNQSLEVAFNSLKTKVDTIEEITIDGNLTTVVEQVQSNTSKIEVNSEKITTLISQDSVIKKQVTDLQGTLTETETTLTSKYTALNQNLDGFKATVADTYATKKSVTDVVDNLSTNYSTTSTMNSAIEQKAQEITASVSSTYATKNEVKTLDDTLKNDYSTTKEMESAIKVAKDAINLGVSQTYETKTNVQNKINAIQVGGRNLILNSKTILLNGSDTGNGNCSVIEKDYVKISPKNNGNIYNTNVYTSVDRMQGETYTLSFDILTPTQIGFYWYPSENYSKPNYINADNKWQRVSFTYTQINADSTSTSAKLFGLQGLVGGQIYKYRNLKLEIGNKATDWIPAPEDVQASIDTKANSTDVYTKTQVYTKAQTDSQINVAKEAINLSVSNTYETKTNVESKISSIESETKSIKQTVSSLVLGTDSISASVKSLQETMTNTTNGLSNEISKIQDQVNLAMTSTDVRIEIQKELQNGVNKVSTSTGFTFDENGLNVSKSDSEMKTQISEDGMKIYKNKEVMLTANNQGVDAKNLHATTYLIIGGNSRMEDFTENGSKRTAVFWIG